MTGCVDSDGNYIRIDESPSGTQSTGVTAQGGVTAGPNGLSTEDTTKTGTPSLADETVVPSVKSTIPFPAAPVKLPELETRLSWRA